MIIAPIVPNSTSCGLGEASPEGFYKHLGFVPTGGMYGDEIELILKIDQYKG